MLIITGVKYKYWTFELTSKFYLFVYSATTIFQILIRFFQRIFSSLFNKFWLFYSNYPLIYIGILYFISAIFIYLLFLFYTSIDIIIIFIFTIISFAIFMYISDNYKYSRNIYIRKIQKFVFIVIKISLLGYLFSFLNLPILNTLFCDSDDEDDDAEEIYTTDEEDNRNSLKKPSDKGKSIAQVSTHTDDKSNEYINVRVSKEVWDSSVAAIKGGAVEVIKDIAPQLGVAAAAGKAAVETIKHTNGMPIGPRAATVFATTTATAVATGLAINVTKESSRNSSILERSTRPSPSPIAGPSSEIIDTKDAGINTNVTVDTSMDTNVGLPLPDGDKSVSNIGGKIINSVLEDSDIPLIVIVNSLHLINYSELSIILGLFSLFFRKYFISKLKIVILKYLNRKVEDSITLSNLSTKLDKYSDYLFFYVFICLIWVKILHIYMSIELVENLDKYVEVYNIIKHNSFLFVFTIKSNNMISITSPLRLNKWIKLKIFKSISLNKLSKYKKLNNPLLLIKLSKIKFIIFSRYILNLIIYYLKIHHIKIYLFIISILVTYCLFISLVYNIQITSNVIEIDIYHYILISNIILPLSSNTRKIHTSKISNLNLVYDINNPIFRELFSILTNNPINHDTQLKIEHFLKNQSLEFTKQKMLSNLNTSNNINISNTLISKLIETKPLLEKLIKNYQINLKLMDDNLQSLNNFILINTNISFIVSIMYGRILTIVSNNQLLNNKTSQVEVTIGLGKEIVSNYLLECFNEVRKSNPNITFVNWKKDNQELINKTENTQFIFELGNVLINFMIDLKLLKVEVKVLGRADKKSILVPGPLIVNLIPKLNREFSIQALPSRIPMIVPGKFYELLDNNYLSLGGYLLNGEEFTDEIILSNWELSSKSRFLKRNDIVDMVNKMNSVAFKINEDVLDFILLNNYKYGFFTKTNYINPLSLKAKLTLPEQRELESFNSRKHLELNILGLATLFRGISNIYLPVRLDYRGRLYCIVEYLNYQGIDLAKGLLQFSKGEKVYLSDKIAINYLKIFGANSFGNKLEKKSFFDRISWIDNNLEDIINFENGILLSKAENKILFLSFCFEFKKYIDSVNNKESYFVSNLPIQLDASCNGFQHLTLLIDDLSLSKELNFNESSCMDQPKDFYTFIALKIKNHFSKKLYEYNQGKLVVTPEDLDSYTKLANVDIYRTLIKKAVMTLPYNASAGSIIEYLKENFDKLKNPNYIKSIDNEKDKYYYIYKMKLDLSVPVFFTELDFKHLRRALSFVIFVEYPKLSALAEYLKSIAKVSNILKIPIPWILPTGLEINQQFYDKENIKVKPFTYTKNLLNLTVLNKKKFNVNKQKIALMPNLVHSLDAASLCLVIVNYFKQNDNVNFYSIHDCFAVPCNKVNNLIGLLKSAYCIIYSNSKYLLEFDSNFRHTIIKSYGEDAVSFNDNTGKLTIKLKNENIILKYPSINGVIVTDSTKINFENSNYLIH